MKAQSAIVFLAALLPVVTADFDIYYSDNKGPAGMGKSYTFYNTGDKPSFNLVKAAHSYPKSSDLSGSDVGVRCKGSKDADGKDCTGESNPDTVQELEMRLLEGSHISMNTLPSTREESTWIPNTDPYLLQHSTRTAAGIWWTSRATRLAAASPLQRTHTSTRTPGAAATTERRCSGAHHRSSPRTLTTTTLATVPARGAVIAPHPAHSNAAFTV